MKIKDIKKFPDDCEIEINSIWNNETGELISTPVSEGHYDERTGKYYITPELMSMKKKSHDELREYAIGILNLFENLLDENNIDIPNEERAGEDEEARLYGDTYYSLEDDIINIIEDI